VVDDVHAHDIADVLNDENIIVRAGLMCAQPLHEFLGATASVRVSVQWYSTQADVEKFIHAFTSAVERLRGV
jgi:cysteine desulfurase/selenocysteine lyase